MFDDDDEDGDVFDIFAKKPTTTTTKPDHSNSSTTTPVKLFDSIHVALDMEKKEIEPSQTNNNGNSSNNNNSSNSNDNSSSNSNNIRNPLFEEPASDSLFAVPISTNPFDNQEADPLMVGLDNNDNTDHTDNNNHNNDSNNSDSNSHSVSNQPPIIVLEEVDEEGEEEEEESLLKKKSDRKKSHSHSTQKKKSEVEESLVVDLRLHNENDTEKASEDSPLIKKANGDIEEAGEEPAEEEAKSLRLDSIDVFRGMAVMAMIIGLNQGI